jgi:hypothetical protein
VKARHPAFWVVGGWALFNGVLLAVLTIYGESPLVYWLWGAVLALLALATLAVLRSSRSGPEQHTRYRVPPSGGGAVLPTAAGVAVLLLGFVYSFWFLVVAGPLLVTGAALALRDRAAGRR